MTSTIDATVLLRALPDGALMVNLRGQVIAANMLACDMLQIDPVGLPVFSVVRTPAFAQAVAQARQTQTLISVDTEFRGQPVRQVQIQISPLKDTGDILILLRDFTREQAIEKMRSDFVANASHEMRTPLTSIIGFVETLQGAAKHDDVAREKFLGTMLVQARRMKRLIDDLLTLSRIELNEHVRPSAQVLLVDVARQAKVNLADAAEKAGVVITLHAHDTQRVAGDAEELLQVAQNLIENAIKYGSSGGRIEIECHTQGAQGVLSVRDYGRGIAEIHLPRLTERFYRVSTQESRTRGGTGLGLAIVKHIVQRHRGRFDIQSKEGAGSTFSISIPHSKS
ncbi:MAG: GHKL domain-containing protein [Alphaproteobacteria bacterium]|nr:GHKL domain-containing protein [Alphaproteobacteria bacterium]